MRGKIMVSPWLDVKSKYIPTTCQNFITWCPYYFIHGPQIQFLWRFGIRLSVKQNLNQTKVRWKTKPFLMYLLLHQVTCWQVGGTLYFRRTYFKDYSTSENRHQLITSNAACCPSTGQYTSKTERHAFFCQKVCSLQKKLGIKLLIKKVKN